MFNRNCWLPSAVRHTLAVLSCTHLPSVAFSSRRLVLELWLQFPLLCCLTLTGATLTFPPMRLFTLLVIPANPPTDDLLLPPAALLFWLELAPRALSQNRRVTRTCEAFSVDGGNFLTFSGFLLGNLCNKLSCLVTTTTTGHFFTFPPAGPHPKGLVKSA